MSFIGGGESNVISSGFSHSAVVGGIGNTVTGHCSVILGGSGNAVSHDYAAVFGNGVSSVANGTMHVNNLWMDPGSICSYPGIAPFLTFPSGTIYVDTVTPGLPLRLAQ